MYTDPKNNSLFFATTNQHDEPKLATNPTVDGISLTRSISVGLSPMHLGRLRRRLRKSRFPIGPHALVSGAGAKLFTAPLLRNPEFTTHEVECQSVMHLGVIQPDSRALDGVYSAAWACCRCGGNTVAGVGVGHAYNVQRLYKYIRRSSQRTDEVSRDHQDGRKEC